MCTFSLQRTKMQEQVSSVKSKNDKLENLCRALQKERKELRDKLDQVGEDTGFACLVDVISFLHDFHE